MRGQSVYFSVYNRGKKSLCLDLRTERGQEIFAELVKTAESCWRISDPARWHKMGFAYDDLSKSKPDIILAGVGLWPVRPLPRAPGFRPAGPGDERAHGPHRQTGRPPLGAATSLVDRYTSLHATIGTLAALHHRDKTGEGQLVDVCLMDSALTMVEIPTSYYLATGEEAAKPADRPTRRRTAMS